MKISKLDISIIVPVYNAEPYLRECLESIYVQTYKEYKCIIVNDGCTDNSQNIIDEYCAKDKRFCCLVKKNEKSAAKARYYALQRTDSEWVMSVDADDVIEPLFLEKIIKRQQETGADCVTGYRIGCIEGIKGEAYRIPARDFDMNQILSGRECCLMMLGGWRIGGAGICRRSIDLQVSPGPYMNSDELGQRQHSLLIHRHAFTDAKYYFRHNIGTSDKVSVRMFDRTLVDVQLVDFVYEHFPERQDKIEALAWQRLFNLIYLTADYHIHKKEFSKEEHSHIENILRISYNAIDRKLSRKVAPYQSTMLIPGFTLFSFFATCYVRYKRSHNGAFYYR